MATNFRRGFKRPAPVAPLAQPFTRAAVNFSLYVQVEQEIKDGAGQSIGKEKVTENRIQGRVLAVKDSNKVDGKEEKQIDDYNRHYISLVIEVEPGKDRYVQTTDPAFQAQILALQEGDLVYVSGELRKNTRGRGFYCRMTELMVLETVNPPDPTPEEASVAGPQLVEKAA